MVAKQLWALVASAAYVAAQIKGFNYGSGASTQDSFEADIKAGNSLPNASGFNSVRLYTMVQDGTQNTPSSAIPAAIAAKGTLLLGLWASAGQTAFNNELAALKSAIQQYGQDFADTVVGISVGSEDLYRITYTSQVVNADPNPGADPDTIVSYISQVRDTIKGTVLSNKMVGHVDTYTAFINGSNAEVINACDFLGMDAYPYYESTLENGIDNAYDLFFSAYDQTTGVSNGKPVWVTETGWPHTGKTYNLAVASVANAEAYWKSVGCALFGKTNVWWYTLSDPGANPAFGVLSGDVSSKPLFDLTCDGSSQPPPSSSSSSTSASSSSSPSNPNSSSGSSSNNTPGSSSASGSSPSGTGSGSTPSSSSNAGNSGASSPPSNPPSSPSSPPSSPSSSPSSPSSPSSSPSSSGMSTATLTGTGTGSGTGGPSASSTTTTPSSSSSTGHTNTPSVAAAHRNLELGAGSAALLALLGYFL